MTLDAQRDTSLVHRTVAVSGPRVQRAPQAASMGQACSTVGAAAGLVGASSF